MLKGESQQLHCKVGESQLEQVSLTVYQIARTFGLQLTQKGSQLDFPSTLRLARQTEHHTSLRVTGGSNGLAPIGRTIL